MYYIVQFASTDCTGEAVYQYAVPYPKSACANAKPKKCLTQNGFSGWQTCVDYIPQLNPSNALQVVGTQNVNCTGPVIGGFSQSADCIFVGGIYTKIVLQGNQAVGTAYKDSKCTQIDSIGGSIALDQCLQLGGPPGLLAGGSARWISSNATKKVRFDSFMKK
jgi:hypothetical protein